MESTPVPSIAPAESPAAGVSMLLASVDPVDTEVVRLAEAAGRVLAQEVLNDRDSPACDMSAMDGFAVRFDDVRLGVLPVRGEARIGEPPVELRGASAVRIVTGAPVPHGADTVIKREDVRDDGPNIVISPEGIARTTRGEAVRRRAENAPAGRAALGPGVVIEAPKAALLATVGAAQVRVFRRVRVEILVTGDELLGVEEAPEAWQIRDSNGPGLAALFAGLAWARLGARGHAADELDRTADAIADAAARADILCITGGVSMGHRDHVPAALERLGARTLFHKIPQRPGKPILAAVMPNGTPVLAFPGNPVSVLVTARRIGLPVARRRAGFAQPLDLPRRVTLLNPIARSIGLWWHRPARLVAGDTCELAPTVSSGDVVGVGATDGFVEVPPAGAGAGPWDFYPWSA